MPPAPAPPSNRPPGSAALGLCAAVAVLILYGSWFPFEWIRPHPDDVAWALTNLNPWTDRADVAGNVALFLHWGLVAALAARQRGRAPAAWALGGGLLLALAGQAGQFFEAHHDPRWADVVWNLAGAGAGLAAAGGMRRLAGHADAPAWALLSGSALTAWLPLWPTLDLARLQQHWDQLADLGLWQGPEAAMMAGLTLVAGCAAARLLRPGTHAGSQARASTARPTSAIVAAGLLVVMGQALIPGTRFSGGSLLGALMGIVLALLLFRRPLAVAAALVALQVLGGLAPFDVHPRPVQVLHLWPFEAMLGGSMLGNAQALARDVWLWGCALWFAGRTGWPPVRTTAACAALALAVEVLQCWMPSRPADVTPALVVLALGWGLAAVRGAGGSVRA